jgi:TolB-like protein
LLATNGDEHFDIAEVRITPRKLSFASHAGETFVEPKVMALLVVLAENAGHVLRRGELIDQLWGIEHGSDESLTRAIYHLRRALKSPHGLEAAIRTISKSGYELVAPVSFQPIDARSKALGRAQGEKPILVVLPFDDMSDDAAMQVFCDGVSEEIIGRLARGSQLRVIGRTSSFRFRGGQKPEAAGVLGASHILDGAIRRSGDRVRISLHLVEAWSQTTVWSDRYDEPIDDILGVQDRIAERVAIALDHAFATPPLSAIDPKIYDLYFQAKSKMIDIRTYAEVIPLLERVTAAAPTFAPAWAALANVRAFTGNFATLSERKPIFASAKTAIANCLAADPGSTETIGPEFWVLPAFGEYEAQHESIKRAIVLGQNMPDLQYIIAQHYVNTGQMREAAKHALIARQLDPASVYNSSIYGRCLYYSGDLNEAREVLYLDVQKFPHNYVCAATLLICAAFLGDLETVDHLCSPERLRLFPFYELSPLIDTARVVLDPTPLG